MNKPNIKTNDIIIKLSKKEFVLFFNLSVM